MKKTAFLLSMLLLAVMAFAQTADEVVNKFIEASGGKEKLNAIQTLQYKQVIKLKSPIGDFEVPVEYYRQHQKFYRMQANIAMGPESLNMFILLSDTAGYVMLPPNPFAGTEGGLQKLEKKDLENQSGQLDAAGMFAALVSYSKNKGALTLLGSEKVNDEDCYKLQLDMGGDQSMTYYINKATNLVTRADAKGAMAVNSTGLGAMMGSLPGESAAKVVVETYYSDYKDVDGIKFPSKIVYKTQLGDSESEVSNIQINKPIDKKWFQPK